ncbi:benzoate/H(+) symporter BenE family transporter [Jeotgalicoccus nanhaiensis]|uniref:Benzoate/H(+) symporter BenE family transporter n=1 Tax=Jeotgalicoccus nanhaiensis TaxID=568603 RepID=A0ABR9Y0G2_9STAP|nr:benzoate/H(+) symporter BenE family transporter [Jeotgalicoccus nanhaiensis]MBF0754460.1 benzoate/H(+) symporter BenE family transporter [Jeotgalicoccus nanhaiensis]TFU61165.1 benzoate/H(+) symporter BenE family transporter [Jeotgalicoccus nanhaiensis]
MNKTYNRGFINDLNTQNISAGIITGTLGIVGAPIIVIEAAAAGGFTHIETISWFYAVQFFGALFGLIMAFYYRMPIVGAHSITGAAFLVTVTPHFTYSELVGGFIITGIIIMLFGISGIFKKVMSWIPREIISAMLAGIITSYVVGLIPAAEELPIVGISAITVFFILTKWNLRIPPMLGSVLTSIIVFFLIYDFDMSALGTEVVLPIVHAPDFSLAGAISISIPLALMILSNDATPAVGALERSGYKVPTNNILTVSGILSIFTSFFGGQSANVAGMMTTIASDEESGDTDKRYVASVISSIIMLIFGLFAWALVPLMFELPEALMAMLAGFVLIGVFASTMRTSFGNSKYQMAVIFTYIISVSGISIFYVSAPVWALLIGTILAKVVRK